jgi:hypothetical protein
VIENKQDATASAKLDESRQSSPVIAKLIAYADSMPARLCVDTESAGLEFLDPQQPRLRMRVVLQESESVLVFLYKKSVLPYSRDRFSYGGVMFGARTFRQTDFIESVEFLLSGFHPDRRPSKLKRAFKYTIED